MSEWRIIKEEPDNMRVTRYIVENGEYSFICKGVDSANKLLEAIEKHAIGEPVDWTPQEDNNDKNNDTLQR